MPQDIRLIGLDLDNTTLNSAKQVTPRVQAAITAAIGAGIVVLPATGRALTAIMPEVLAIPGIRYVLTSNGAKVYDMPSSTVVYSNCFARGEALDLLDFCHGYQCLPSAYVDGIAYMEPFDFAAYSADYTPEVIEYMRKTRTWIDDLRRQIAESHEVEKFSLIFRNADERTRARNDLIARGGCAVTSSMASNLELNTASCNKGTALLALAAQLGITQPQVMAVGDSTNDLEMLRAVGYAVAMGNSHPKVLAAAHAVTTTADEDGVALAIEAVMPQRWVPTD